MVVGDVGGVAAEAAGAARRVVARLNQMESRYFMEKLRFVIDLPRQGVEEPH
jgi:hypothetical protein